MYSLGIDLGSSSVKVSLLNIESGKVIGEGQSPESELEIIALRSGYAEQHPDTWWHELRNAIHKLFFITNVSPRDIKCIGIAYQMHGLVTVNKEGKVIRPAIIWCDSRAVESGEIISELLGKEFCLETIKNLPGNFTASKLKWIKDNEPENFLNIYKIMLPGDWLAYRLTGEIFTTISGLSEGTLWDFKNNIPAKKLLDAIEISEDILPPLVPVFGDQGKLTAEAAIELGLPAGVPISYRSGDQPNNAFSLNVLEPGEVAATAGTSGVVYAVADRFDAGRGQGVNAFAHVNHQKDNPRLGILLCINGTGIANSWVRKLSAETNLTYNEMNISAGKIPIGSGGISFIPFGNGAERILNNAEIGSSIHGINFNIHSKEHIYRAVQEGIAFSFYYGMKKMAQAGVKLHTLKAGKANLFQSPVFTETLATITNCSIQLYNTNGAAGAARGAALGRNYYQNSKDCFKGLNLVEAFDPIQDRMEACKEAYLQWENILEKKI